MVAYRKRRDTGQSFPVDGKGAGVKEFADIARKDDARIAAMAKQDPQFAGAVRDMEGAPKELLKRIAETSKDKTLAAVARVLLATGNLTPKAPGWHMIMSSDARGNEFMHFKKMGAEADRVHLSLTKRPDGWHVNFYGYDPKGTGAWEQTLPDKIQALRYADEFMKSQKMKLSELQREAGRLDGTIRNPTGQAAFNAASDRRLEIDRIYNSGLYQKDV